MQSAFEFVQQIAEWVGKFIPRWEQVAPWEAAVKIVKGTRVIVCPAGIHWWWPVTSRFVRHPIARQTNNLKTQTITLADGKVVAVGGLCVFEIKDIKAAIVDTYDPDDTIKDISLSAIHDTICLLTWDQLLEQQRSGELDRKLKVEAKRELDRYGVRVLKMTLTDLAPAKVLKIVQATTVD